MRKGLTLSLAKQRQSVLEFLSHSVSSQVILVNSCHLSQAVLLDSGNIFDFSHAFESWWRTGCSQSHQCPQWLFSKLFVGYVSSLLLDNGEQEQGSSPNASKALPSTFLTIFLNDVHPSSPLQLFAIHIPVLDHSFLASRFSKLHQTHPRHCTLDPPVCLQAVTSAKHSSPCGPLSLPPLLSLPLILCLDF